LNWNTIRYSIPPSLDRERENSTPSPHPELTPETNASDWGRKKEKRKKPSMHFYGDHLFGTHQMAIESSNNSKLETMPFSHASSTFQAPSPKKNQNNENSKLCI
jgi:hypothetical protein